MIDWARSTRHGVGHTGPARFGRAATLCGPPMQPPHLHLHHPAPEATPLPRPLNPPPLALLELTQAPRCLKRDGTVCADGAGFNRCHGSCCAWVFRVFRF